VKAKKPRNAQAGAVLVFVLLALFLSASIASAIFFLHYQGVIAARGRALLAYNQGRLIAAKPLLDRAMMTLAEEARNWARTHVAPSGYAFGSANAGSVASSLQPLVQLLQNQANALFCSQTTAGISLRIHFLATACNSPLPDGLFLPQPRRVSGGPGNLEVYEVPFVAVQQASLEANQRSRWVEGVLRLRVGGGPTSQYQIYLGSGYQPDGTPAYFSGGEVYEGLVHVSGIPNFGLQWPALPGPFFLSGFSTGRCVATSSSGCVGGQGAVGLVQVGAVDPEVMAPSPFNPCYGASCPRFPGGVDWNAPGLPPPTDSAPPTFEYATPGNYSAALSIVSYSGGSLPIPAGTPVQRITLTAPDGSTIELIVTREGYVALRQNGNETPVSLTPGSPVLRVGGNLNLAGPPGAAGLEGSTSFTLRAQGDVRILGDLLSSAPPCRNAAGVSDGKPVPSDCPGGGRGIFGLYSETGDVLFVRNAPSQIYLTAVIAAPRGTFGPEGYPSTPGVGRVFLQGAFLAQNYRSFLSPDGRAGWQFQFAYDPRLSPDGGQAPPGWPSLPRGVWGVSVVYTRETTP
jgi:hypothetical protein